ncbi:MAG: CPBP family intramembrane metalloprotease [Clostridia bacterium]|nr:CPBP family intramembrane metalloprotease [Clostridia bacterium]
MKKLYKKSRLTFSIIWIAAYCVLMSIGDILSESVGISKAVTLPIALTMSVVLLIFIKRNGLSEEYGLCKSKVSARKMLFYLPLAILMSANLINGLKLNLSLAETVLYILTMFCVGFLEEVIFRGLLFKAMAENGVKSAIIVSSITFGMGHIINLFNGSGAELLPNILQIIYATAAGFMLVMIFHKTGSLIPCIVFHGIFNTLSVFADESVLSLNQRIISCVFLVIVSGGYGAYIALKVKKINK